MSSKSGRFRKAQGQLIVQTGMMHGEIIFDVFEVFRGGWRPADTHHG
jgi:hypothetical protein